MIYQVLNFGKTKNGNPRKMVVGYNVDKIRKSSGGFCYAYKSATVIDVGYREPLKAIIDTVGMTEEDIFIDAEIMTKESYRDFLKDHSTGIIW